MKARLVSHAQGCGKVLGAGDWITERDGIVLCEGCNGKYAAPWYIIYAIGRLAEGVVLRCGEKGSEAKEVKE